MNQILTLLSTAISNKKGTCYAVKYCFSSQGISLEDVYWQEKTKTNSECMLSISSEHRVLKAKVVPMTMQISVG